MFITIVTGTLNASTAILFVALGEVIVEKSGVLNLGLEGMMLTGAVFAFMAALNGVPVPLAIVIGAIAGMAMSMIFGVLALTFIGDQSAIGVALTIFGVGFADFIGRHLGGVPVTPLAKVHIPVLTDLPIVGPLFFHYDALVYIGLGMAVALNWFLRRTRQGRILRAAGEAPANARAIGSNVTRIRYLAVLFGGAMAGIGGAYLSVAYTPLWIAHMTAGQGWIALALVVFGTWRPYRIVLGAWLFGLATVLELQAQVLGANLPTEALAAIPYIVVIVVLALISRNRRLIAENFPAALGKAFRAGG